jgi:hypothetical protein
VSPAPSVDPEAPNEVSVARRSDSHGRRCRPRHTADVGFDPTRKHKRTSFDYFYVAAGVIVCVALVLWALLG